MQLIKWVIIYNYVNQFGPYMARPDKCMIDVTVNTLWERIKSFLFKYSRGDLK